jgi:hypothetical protein
LNEYQQAALESAIRGVRTEVAGVVSTILWIGFLAAVFVIPSRDVESEVAACQAEAIGYKVGLSGQDYFIGRCMSGRGYDLRHEQPACNFAVLSEGCYEKRGMWRSIKLTASEWWSRIDAWRTR